MKSSIRLFILLTILLSVATSVFAADGVTTLEKVSDPVCTIDTDVVHFEKQMIEFRKDTKDLTIELRVQNKKTPEEENIVAGEFILVIDNSQSTTEMVDATTSRRDAILKASSSLVNKLFATNPEIKIGIVSFSSLDSTKGEQEGTINDAKLRTAPTSDQATVKNAIDTIAKEDLGPRTNLEAGISIAQDNFSKDAKIKNMIIISDGLPNTAVGGPTITYSGETAVKTRAKLTEIQKNNINIFTVLTGVNTNDMSPAGKTYAELAKEIFGTPSNPDFGFFFNIADSQIESTICDSIYSLITVPVDNTVKDLNIYDYFPQEIVDNFKFEYVTKPTHGTISESIDPETRSIKWFIPELKEGETATVSYRLSLAENYDPEIIDVVLPTNEKVDLDYVFDNEKNQDTSDTTPEVVVRYTEPEKEDNTIVNTDIPQTGETSLKVLSVVTIAGIATFLYIKNRKYIIK